MSRMEEYVMRIGNDELVGYVECLDKGQMPPQLEKLSDGSSMALVKVHMAVVNEATRRFCNYWKRTKEASEKFRID